MSKYIRTEDGIHIKNIFGKETDEKRWEGLGYKVINQADTIEELCDVFVLLSEPLNYHCGFSKLSTAKKHFYLNTQADNILKYELKGAIWTDKGLIYVAKMNDKGELELI